ncbi:ThuA domain-containing protein [Cyclobacterium sp.]|uniref:ThuA domain-containing protein n=1 Tax=Cyclobacterium sp. TaxID=1966343 RepID=UPI0019C942C4|nr:ThuA domain-containing protein [Cyclobacterium sp.]MBD3630191.1 ThuA domain-containing protein [Cyclobacterium sp.]
MKRNPKFSQTIPLLLLAWLCIFPGNGRANGCLPDVTNPPADPIRVLLLGGGASHDFDTWYKNADVETLEKGGFAEVTYTDDPESILALLDDMDVLYLSNNQPIADPATRKAIFDFAASGKGLILGHAALWYNWEDWPEYNVHLASGGSRGHDRFGAFDVTVLDKNHPVMEGLPPSFKLKDELYYFKVDKDGPGIKVLAEASTSETGPFPSIFVIKHPDTRMVGIALGHDGESHNLDTYQKLLRNAVSWVAGK